MLWVVGDTGRVEGLSSFHYLLFFYFHMSRSQNCRVGRAYAVRLYRPCSSRGGGRLSVYSLLTCSPYYYYLCLLCLVVYSDRTRFTHSG